jgi:hypothetical protein
MSRSLSKNAGNRSVENQPKRSFVEMYSRQMKPRNGAGSVSDLNCIPVRVWGAYASGSVSVVHMNAVFSSPAMFRRTIAACSHARLGIDLPRM